MLINHQLCASYVVWRISLGRDLDVEPKMWLRQRCSYCVPQIRKP